MRLHYLHSTNVQMPSANAVQTLHMCEAFAEQGAQVVLSYPRYLWGNRIAASECHQYYGVTNRFAMRPLLAPFTAALMKTPGYLPAAKLAAYAVVAAQDVAAGEHARLDVIYTRCATAALVMPFLRRRDGRPVIVFEAHEYPRDRARARALRYVDAVVAITNSAAQDLHTALGIPENRLLVAPDGVPEAWLGSIDRADARRVLGLPADRPLVVYTGSVHPDTQHLLFETGAGLRGVAELIVVGAAAGEARARPTPAVLNDRARAQGLPMRFVGQVPVEQVRLYQAAADVLLAAYSGQLRWARYTSPLKLFEYMAAERPIVVSDLPVLHEVLRHEETAWFVPAANGAALAEGVRTLLKRPHVAAALGRRARQEAPTYTWSRRASTILDFLRRRPWDAR